jgi:hypothetical protein
VQPSRHTRRASKYGVLESVFDEYASIHYIQPCRTGLVASQSIYYINNKPDRLLTAARAAASYTESKCWLESVHSQPVPYSTETNHKALFRRLALQPLFVCCCKRIAHPRPTSDQSRDKASSVRDFVFLAYPILGLVGTSGRTSINWVS